MNPKSISIENSGINEVTNYSLESIENEIDDVLRAAGSYFVNNPPLQSIIRRYQKWTFLAYTEGDIFNNESGLNDSELKSFLKIYDENFKIPVKKLLQDYYRIKFNPELNFNGTFLTSLGFNTCLDCLDTNGGEYFSIANLTEE